MFILFVVFAVIALALLGGSFFLAGKNKQSPDYSGLSPRTGTRIGAAVVAIIAVIVLLFGSITSVGTKDIGVETAYGKTVGHLGPGLHLIAPWDSVTVLDGTIQTDSWRGSNNCLDVRIGYSQTACAEFVIRWRINPDKADSLFQNYRTFAKIQDSLVYQEISTALNTQLSNYNPLDAKNAPPLATVAQSVTSEMQQEIGPDGIDVLSTNIPILHYDPQTQNRINQIQSQYAQTLVATEQKATNKAVAAANAELSKNGQTLTPQILANNCLNLTTEAEKTGYQLPAGWNCNYVAGSGSNLAGIIANTSGSSSTASVK